MSLTTLNTEHFSDVEVAARDIAEEVRDIKLSVLESRTAAELQWKGKGRDEFHALSLIIEQQIKDISDEFWDIYEDLISAENSFLETDQELATSFTLDDNG